MCIGPSIAPGAPASSYFDLSASPGSTTTESMVVANPNPYACGVTLSPALGITVVNGGDTYAAIAPGQPCSGAACWLAGLPQTVTVSANNRVLVPFSVQVPLAVASGQYLAGVVGEPSTGPEAPQASATSGQVGGVGASVEARVAIGVAVTVTGSLQPLMVISSVQLESAGLVSSTIAVTVHNTGNTWVHPKGTVAVAVAGTDKSADVSSGTVLPGDTANLSTPESSVPGGLHHVVVSLDYADGVAPATWSGELRFPQPPVVHVNGGTITVVTPSGLPKWAVALLIGLVAVIVGLTVALLVVWRRRRRRERGGGRGRAASPPEQRPLHGIRRGAVGALGLRGRCGYATAGPTASRPGRRFLCHLATVGPNGSAGPPEHG